MYVIISVPGFVFLISAVEISFILFKWVFHEILIIINQPMWKLVSLHGAVDQKNRLVEKDQKFGN